MVGPPLQDGFALALGLSGADVDRAVAAYRAHYAAGAMLDAPPYAGVPELLDTLLADGATLAVATSKPEPFAVRILGHVGLLDRFASVHGATLDGAVRHKDQVVAAALARHPRGHRPVLVGDRAQDVRRRRCPRAAVHRRGLGACRGRRAGGGGCRADRGRAGRRARRAGENRLTARRLGDEDVPVRAMTEQQVRRSFVNCSRGEARGLTLPKGFAELDWAELDLLGWRDPRAPLRGYLVVDVAEGAVGVAVRAAESRMSSRTAVMCLLCQTGQAGDAVSLFTARRTGDAGRNGNTVGTYICADLGCSGRVRTEIPLWLQARDPDEVVAERAAELRERAEGFLAAVRR